MNYIKLTLKEEQKLITKAQKDSQEFAGLYDVYFDRIFHYILKRTANVALAEDFTSQVFFHAQKNLHKFKWTGISISSWLYRIATNEVNGYYRKQKKYKEEPIPFQFDTIEDNKLTPDEEMLAAEQSLEKAGEFLKIHEFIQTELKPEDQSLIVLRYFENKPYAEISEILNIKEGTLRMRLKRSLEKIKNYLNKTGGQDGFKKSERHRNA